jgi:hypothetical protein
MFPKPSFYKNKLKNTNTSFFLQLEQLNKNMKTFKIEPTYEVYKKNYEDSMNKINDNDIELQLLKNSIEKESENINIHIQEADHKIDTMEMENVSLKRKTDDLKDEKLASKELKKDFQLLYNKKTTELIGYSVLILAVGTMLYRNFRK